MKHIIVSLCACIVIFSGCGSSKSFDFEKETAGEIPQDWTSHQWGEGVANWKITDDDGNKVFAQLQSENPKAHFNIVVYEGLEVKDADLSVKFKAVNGTFDQGGGFVWRYQDEANHYIVRANPLENNVVLYKMQNGVRTNLPMRGYEKTYGIDVKPLGADWHTLGLEAEGNFFRVELDGNELFTVHDSTFTAAGKIGLWSKADAVTYFDDLQVSGAR